MSDWTYLASGVDQNAALQIKNLYKPYVRSTFGPQVLGDVGLFSGLFRLQGYHDPVLVASTDGVGTKLKLATWTGLFDNLGHDVVNQSVNDLLTTGAIPLFFLDYIAVETLVPDQLETLVKGVAQACLQAGCVLLGGETSQMSGVFRDGAFELAGFAVGAVERNALLNPSSIQAGDILLGIPSNGLHTNGYSLVRAVFNLEEDPSPLKIHHPDLGWSLGEELLKPHMCYYPMLDPVLPLINGMAHITGGGIVENLNRIIPHGLTGYIDWASWEIPAIFQIIQRHGSIAPEEMEKVFNLGIGMVLVCKSTQAGQVLDLVPQSWVMGHVISD